MCPESDASEPRHELVARILGVGDIPEPRAPVDPSDFIHSKEALVGVFDFLGYKQIMSYSNLFEVASQFIAISDIVKNCGESCNKFELDGKTSKFIPGIIQMSDTFVVYTLGREPQDIIQFFWNVHHMLFYAIHSRFPLRGALTTGEMLIGKGQSNILLGPALREAFELEKSQEWSGACIGRSLNSYIDEAGIKDDLFPLVLPYDVPFKDDTNLNSDLAINWIADVANFISPEFLLDKFPSFKPNSRVEAKVNNTVKFLSFALEQKIQQGPFRSPKNRKIILEPCPDLGCRIVRFVSDEDV
jgi:hypothetical protein